MNFRVLSLLLCGAIAIGAYSQKTTKAETDAANIIMFGNSVIDIGNSYNQTIGNFRSLLTITDGNINAYSRNPDLPMQGMNCAVITVQSNQQTAYSKALKAVQTFPEKADIVRYVEEGEKDIATLTKYCDQMKQYFLNKEHHKDDQFEKYVAMRDSFNYYIEKAGIAWYNASKLASDAGNRAELMLLEKSPLAAFIIPMKKDLNSLEGIFKMFENTDTSNESIKTAIANLQESINTNKTTDGKDLTKLKDLYYKDAYKTFYQECASSATTLKGLADRMDKEKDPEVLNGWFKSAGLSYNRAIEQYNTFVGQ